MSAPHEVLDAASEEEARAMLTRCCGAVRWVDAMLARRPFASRGALDDAAAAEWNRLSSADWLEAFRQHPPIGGDCDGDVGAAGAPAQGAEHLRATAEWSRLEQSGVRLADADTLRALREANTAYLKRFGFVFLVCATGKSAQEMLALLQARMGNPPEVELRVASREQAKITALRLEKLGR
jgi:2-oxo-4-hydroxy-4-carboxy-5-ureidoimidazoline decarboxylase